ncbi:unnamed protein product, partial [marine sediment metagenome]
MPDLYLSDTRRIRHVGGLVVVEYLGADGETWIAEKKPATIQLTPEGAIIPAVANGYGTPCVKTLVMGGAGQNHPYYHLEYDPDAEEAGWWHFALPPNFDPTKDIKLSVYWIAETLTEGDVVWGVKVLGQ